MTRWCRTELAILYYLVTLTIASPSPLQANIVFVWPIINPIMCIRSLCYVIFWYYLRYLEFNFSRSFNGWRRFIGNFHYISQNYSHGFVNNFLKDNYQVVAWSFFTASWRFKVYYLKFYKVNLSSAMLYALKSILWME